MLRAMLGQTESDLAVCDYYRWNGKPDGVYNRSEELLKTDVEREENAARAKKVLRADSAEKAGAEAVSQQRAVRAEGVRVYNRSEYVSDYSCAEIPVAGACYTAAVRLGKSVSGKT